MANNNNGFAEAINRLNTVMDVMQTVQVDVLKEAAEYFVQKLKPNIPRTKRNKRHLADALKIVVKGDRVQVVFEDWAYYWHLAEKGHRKVGGGKVKGRHFVRNTLDAERQNLTNILKRQIIERLEG